MYFSVISTFIMTSLWVALTWFSSLLIWISSSGNTPPQCYRRLFQFLFLEGRNSLRKCLISAFTLKRLAGYLCVTFLYNYLLSARDIACPELSETGATSSIFPTHWLPDISCHFVYVSLPSAALDDVREEETRITCVMLLCSEQLRHQNELVHRVGCEIENYKSVM